MRNVMMSIFLCLIVFSTCKTQQEQIPNNNSTSRETLNKTNVDVSGLWEVTASTPRGQRKTELTIRKTESQFSGQTDDETFPIQVNGDQISWSQKQSTPMGEMELNFQGTVLDNNNIEGVTTMSSGPMAGREMKWTAKRLD